MRHSIEMEKLTLGVCYYPEHWDRALWKDDLQRMKQYGIEVIRLAEFSWALMEPEEGKYDFSGGLPCRPEHPPPSRRWR